MKCAKKLSSKHSQPCLRQAVPAVNAITRIARAPEPCKKIVIKIKTLRLIFDMRL